MTVRHWLIPGGPLIKETGARHWLIPGGPLIKEQSTAGGTFQPAWARGSNTVISTGTRS